MPNPDRPTRRLQRKERKRLVAERQLLPRRRAYRAAQEVLDQGLRLWKMADNKTRLALMLLGPLNVVLLAFLSNSDIYDAIPARGRIPVVIGVVVYAGLAMTMFLLAINALQPERTKPVAKRRVDDTDPLSPLGLRHFPDILNHDLAEYMRAWREVKMGQLVNEVAEQAHAVAAANRRKFRMLYHLYRGLMGMMALALILMVAIGATLVLQGRTDTVRLKHGVKVTIPPLRHPSPSPRPTPHRAAQH